MGKTRTLWVLSEDQKIYQYNYSAESWTEIGSGSYDHISIANITNAFAISATTGQIIRYTYEMSFWGIIPGAVSGQELIVSDPTQIASVDYDNFFVIGGKWLWGYSLKGAWVSHQFSENLISVSADSKGNGWVLDAQGNLYIQKNSSGPVPPLTIDVPVKDFIQVSALNSSDDTPIYVAALSKSGNIWQYDGASWTQMPLPSTSIDVGTLTSISSFPIGPNPGLFAVNSNGQVFLILSSKDPKDPGTQWIPCNKGMAAISASSTTVWGMTSENLPIRLSDIEQMSIDGNPARVKARGRQGPNWDNQNPFDESLSTHLWIVNRAATLAAQESTYGSTLSGLFKNPIFYKNLCQGLYDPDYLPQFANPFFSHGHLFSTYASHFYDPESGENYFSKNWPKLPDNKTTATALTSGIYYFQQALNFISHNVYDQAGYNLGVSLHYMTDLTQPMHASNYTWLSSHPKPGYHTAFEGYSMEVQDTINVLAPRNYISDDSTHPKDYLIKAASKAKSAYAERLYGSLGIYLGFFDKHKEIANAALPFIFRDAIIYTAQYLICWTRQVGQTIPPALEDADSKKENKYEEQTRVLPKKKLVADMFRKAMTQAIALSVSSSMSSEFKPLDAFKRQLKALLEEQYQFSIKRSSANTLLIEFTSEDEVMGSPEDTIQPNLKQLIALLNSAIVEKGIKNNQYKMDIDLEKGKLTIIAREPKVLNGIAELLERAGRPGKGISYLTPLSQVKEALFGSKRSKSVVSGSRPEPTVSCLMQ